jgi:hypothetical protein
VNLAQAKAALRRLYGKKALYRYDEKAPTADERQALRERVPDLRSQREAARAARLARRDELLADPHYRDLLAIEQSAEKALESTLSRVRHYRVTIMTDEGFAHHVRAQGDNWQDAIDKARAERGHK